MFDTQTAKYLPEGTGIAKPEGEVPAVETDSTAPDVANMTVAQAMNAVDEAQIAFDNAKAALGHAIADAHEVLNRVAAGINA